MWSAAVIIFYQVKMGLQLYEVENKNYLLDFKSLDMEDHPDAVAVRRMTRSSMSTTAENPIGSSISFVFLVLV